MTGKRWKLMTNRHDNGALRNARIIICCGANSAWLCGAWQIWRWRGIMTQNGA